MIPAFTPGEVIETRRIRHGGSALRAVVLASPRRYVVDATSTGGYLYVHPEGQARARWNAYIVDESDAHRPAPGEIAQEYGR